MILAIERDANELAVINNNGNIIAASRNSFFLPKIYLLEISFLTGMTKALL